MLMSAIDTCPNCKRQAMIAFSEKLTERFLVCQFCDFTGPATDLHFDPKPEFLFKYRPHDNFSKSWILDEELFLPSPLSFNDPFDSRITANFDGDESQRRSFFSQFIDLTKPGMKKRERARFITDHLKIEDTKINVRKKGESLHQPHLGIKN